MTLPASGTITMAQVNVELGRASTAPLSLNDSAVRTLFQRPSGAISMSDGWGKSNSSHTVSAGFALDTTGFFAGRTGSITPTTFRGVTITGVYNYANYIFAFDLAGSGHPREFLTILTIAGITYYSNAANHGSSGTATWWNWSNLPPLVAGNSYPITIT